jgi:cation diffusion facilitator CzcD-associated flavoprotein CzcO
MLDAEVIIIGAGPSSIALAHTLKHKLGLKEFTVRMAFQIRPPKD